uniref:Uncharacterized protein n=1 Tax=Anguilla anguilla TaxID=7936 RepID=A0A0E9P5F6_ANGAN
MLRTSHSSSSQRYSMGLLSGECACDCNRLKSPLHSWNQLEMMRVFETYHIDCDHKGMYMVSRQNV